MNLVTADEAKFHLRIDAQEDDSWLELWIPIVSQAVLSWLKDDWRAYELETDSSGAVVTDSSGNPVPVTDSTGDPIPNQLAKGAVILELAAQYAAREGDDRTQMVNGWGYTLGIAATNLLSGIRKPTVI